MDERSMSRQGRPDGDGAGAQRWFLNTLASVEVPGALTGGALDVVAQTLPAGYAPPAHVHLERDEVLCVVSGELEVRCGASLRRMGPGAVMHLPRGTAHSLSVSLAAAAEVLVISAPSGYDGLVDELGVAAAAPELPAPSVPDLDRLAALGRRFDFVLTDEPYGSS